MKYFISSSLKYSNVNIVNIQKNSRNDNLEIEVKKPNLKRLNFKFL